VPITGRRIFSAIAWSDPTKICCLEGLLRRIGASGQLDQRDHIGLDVVCDFRIGLQLCQGSRARHRLAVGFKTFGIEFQRFRRVA